MSTPTRVSDLVDDANLRHMDVDLSLDATRNALSDLIDAAKRAVRALEDSRAYNGDARHACERIRDLDPVVRPGPRRDRVAA